MVTIKISNRAMYSLLVVFGIILLSVGVYAYGTNSPSTMGHSGEELEGVCLSDGVNCEPIIDERFTINIGGQLCFDSGYPTSCSLNTTYCNANQKIMLVEEALCGVGEDSYCAAHCSALVACDGDVYPGLACGTSGTINFAGGSSLECISGSSFDTLKCLCISSGGSYQKEVGSNTQICLS